MKHRFFRLLACALLGSWVFPAHALELHVSPDGRDTNSGSLTSPLQTIDAARSALRASGRLGKKPCTVVIRGGVYRLATPITFGPADGGSEAAPVIYRAAEGERVVLTGAQPIDSPWKPWKNGTFRTNVGDLDAIDQLFVNGQRQTMARYPNDGAGFVATGGDPSHRGKKAGNVPYNGSAPDAWDASKAKGWKDPTGAFMHGMHGGLWGSQHYRVLGKNPDGSLKYEGGWQNNRARSSHAGYRMIENIFEELDAPGEWFHDTESGWLYYMPAEGVDLGAADIEAVLQIKHLIEVYGEYKTPVATMDIKGGNGLPVTTVQTHETTRPTKHLRFEGLHFTGTARTVMLTVEPLLRSDWSIYRGGAVHLRGTEGVAIERCRFEELGGNAVFVDGYNRDTVIRGNRFRDNGASDVNFVGSPAAVRDPAFSFGAPAQPLETIDTEVGPKTDEYPADGLVEDNLMTRPGRFEKQVAGVNLSMASRITIRHNTISHTPRAAINVCDGTWGGHLIEWNDCYETVLETHDHGAFNSWGRDRVWFPSHLAGPNKRDESGKAIMSYYLEKYPDAYRWDAYQTIVMRHNRMHCDHGWDIDLDDGATNYEITNNLCLSGGLKTREGAYRIVTNNVIIGGFTCNVPYPKPTYDVFERNIVTGRRFYNVSNPTLWGGTRNHNFGHNPNATQTEPALRMQGLTQDDAGSLYGNAKFVDPENGDFRVADDSPALKVGFVNFPMTGFGVTSSALRAEAEPLVIRLPDKYPGNRYSPPPAIDFMGAKLKDLDTEAEITATGMQERIGALLLDVPADSELAALGFETGDVVLVIDQSLIDRARGLRDKIKRLKPGRTYSAKVWRSQEDHYFSFELP